MKEFSLFLTRRDGWAPRAVSPTAEPYDVSTDMAGGREAAKWRGAGREAGRRLGLAGKQRPFLDCSSYTLNPLFLHSWGLTLQA